MDTLGNTTFGYSPQSFTGITPETYITRLWKDRLDSLTNPVDDVEINVAGWDKSEIEVVQDGQYVTVDLDGGTYKKVYVGNNKVSKATYKAGMLTLHFEDTTSVIPIE